jgi:tRNA dimethylallyltransferase
LLFSVLDARFEVVNADSMQVYRHMDIGTAKPSADDLRRLPHHLVSVVDPSEQFNAGRFVTEAERLIPDIAGRGRVAVVSGGTAFYITSLLYGMPEAPAVDASTRERLRVLERDSGHETLYRILQERDPEAAERIHPNDRYRVMRALEVIEGTGRSLFSFRWPRTPRPDMRFLLIGLERPRDELYRRIDQRVESMFDRGLLGEVKALLARGYGTADPGMRGIGYRELLEMRSGCETISAARERISQSTRRYAKRQLTFFHAVPEVSWMAPDKPLAVRARIDSFITAST